MRVIEPRSAYLGADAATEPVPSKAPVTIMILGALGALVFSTLRNEAKLG